MNHTSPLSQKEVEEDLRLLNGINKPLSEEDLKKYHGVDKSVRVSVSRIDEKLGMKPNQFTFKFPNKN